jgi:hypothetical protein
LKRQLRDAGFEVLEARYWNSVLLPIAAMVRLARKIKAPAHGGSDIGMPPAAINAALATLMRLEALLGRAVPSPFGLSVFSVAVKPGGAGVRRAQSGPS